MERVTLGSTTLEISRIGFGAWAAGGSDWFHGWSGQKDEDSVAAIQRAVALGVNWIDTAAVYGFGHSEKIVGRALDGVRPRPYVFTKCGALEGAHGEIRSSLARDSILAEAEASLRRLHIDQIDVYQIHRPRPAGELEEGWKALAELREQGVVRHIGASNVTVEDLRRLETIAPVEIVQPRYSLLAREAEDELLPSRAAMASGSSCTRRWRRGCSRARCRAHDWKLCPPRTGGRNDERFAEPYAYPRARTCGACAYCRFAPRGHGRPGRSCLDVA